MAGKKQGMASLESFLETYKKLEQAIRDAKGRDFTVADYESTLSGPDRDKLSLCRKFRNYAQHNPDAGSFLAVTDGMITFVSSMASAVEASRTFAGKLARRIKAVGASDNISMACSWMAKWGTDAAPVVNSDGKYIGLVTMELAKTTLAKGAGESPIAELTRSFPAVVQNIFPVREDEAIDLERSASLAAGGTLIVVRTDGRYLGIISRKAGNW